MHALEALWAQSYHAILTPDKLFHSFLGPFFFVMSGFFFRVPEVGFRRFLALRFLRRIVPTYLFLGLILPWYATGLPISGWRGPLETGLVLYLLGIPVLSWTSWFLIALFSGELLLYFVLPRVRSLGARLAAAFGLYSVGWTLSDLGHSSGPVFAFLISIWFFREAFVIAGLLLFGYAIKPLMAKLTQSGVGWAAVLGLVAAAVCLGSFDHNVIEPPAWGATGAEQEGTTPFHPSPVMSLGIHGSFGWWIVSALSGALMGLCIARLTPPLRPLLWLGRKTLPLFGLNAILLHFLNDWALSHVELPDSVLATQLAALVLTFGGLLLCAPFAALLERGVPQLLGHPFERGPLLPPLGAAAGR